MPPIDNVESGQGEADRRTAGWPGRDRLTMYFQPQVRLPSREVFGYETLLRVRQPSGSLAPPAVVLDAVDRLPLPERMARHRDILDLALSAARAATTQTGLRASVNVPPRLFADPVTMDRLRHANGEGITLEILESDALDVGLINEAITHLRPAGYAFAMDDFGTGYSSPAILVNLNGVDYAKLDRSFLADRSRPGRRLFAATCAVVQACGTQLLIEGVETPADHAACIAAHADGAQGFWYGRPSAQTPYAARRRRTRPPVRSRLPRGWHAAVMAQG